MNYSLAIMSCDKNIGLLDVYFKYFSQFFKSYSGTIYLGLEKSDYSFEGLTIETIHSNKKWSGRLRDVISKVNTQAILLMLDDFIIEKPVNVVELDKLADYICNDNSIAHFALTTVPMKNVSEKVYFDSYYERYKYGRYKTTLQCGIWNRDELLEVSNEIESAWEFELFANMRSFCSKRIYYAISKREKRPIEYNDGLFCVQGFVNAKEKQRLEKKFGDVIEVFGIPENTGVLNRDRIKPCSRIFRRMKIIVMYVFYRLKALLKK